MKQNILNNIHNNNISDTNTYCSKCLRELDSEDSDVVKDVDNNFFCDKWCKVEFHKENRKLIEEVIGGF